MTGLPEIIRAGADDWLFIVFVVFGIAGQAIDAKRKKKLRQEKASQPVTKPAAVAPMQEANTPQEDLDTFLQALGMKQKNVAPEPMVPPPPICHVQERVPEFRPEPSPNPVVAAVAPVQQTIALVKADKRLPADQPSCTMVMQGIKMPTIQMGPRMNSGTRTHVSLNLKTRNQLRRAILNQEILGKPKAMERNP